MDLKYPEIVGELVELEAGSFAFKLIIGENENRRSVLLDFIASDDEIGTFWQAQQQEPCQLPRFGESGLWAFRNTVLSCPETEAEILGANRLALLIKHRVLQQKHEWARIQRQVTACENMTSALEARRERISDSVRLFVWQRDEGRCVRCGSSQRLEFDHIIPLAEGGSNTDRNIQLLCESCNRSKGHRI